MVNLVEIEKRIVTQQQEVGFEAYKAALEEADGNYDVLPFEQFYMHWQFENGLFDDAYLLEKKKDN